MMNIEELIQSTPQRNSLGSLRDVHVELMHRNPIILGWFFRDPSQYRMYLRVTNESNPLNKMQAYLTLTSGEDSFYRKEYSHRYKTIEENLRWGYEHLLILDDTYEILSSLGYEMQYPMKYLRRGVRHDVQLYLYHGSWKISWIETHPVHKYLENLFFEADPFRDGQDEFLRKLLQYEEEHLTLEELPSLNQRLKERLTLL